MLRCKSFQLLSAQKSVQQATTTTTKTCFFSLNKSEEHIVHSPQFIWNRSKSQNNPTTDFVLQIHLTEAIHIKTD